MRARLYFFEAQTPACRLLQEEELHHNITAGVVLSDHSLVLQSITRESAGGYTCMAANVEGRAKSNVVNLEVMCKYVLRALYADGERARVLVKAPLNGPGFLLTTKFNTNARFHSWFSGDCLKFAELRRREKQDSLKAAKIYIYIYDLLIKNKNCEERGTF